MAKSESTLDDRIVTVLEQLAKNAPLREPGFGDPEYQQRLQDEGFLDTFATPVYQNGREANPRGLSAQTRERACALRPGLYLGGRVQVDVDRKGGVHLHYKSATVEDRMRLEKLVADFSDLIDQLWAEMHRVLTSA